MNRTGVHFPETGSFAVCVGRSAVRSVRSAIRFGKPTCDARCVDTPVSVRPDEPIAADDRLAHVGLFGSDEVRGERPPVPVRETGVVCGRPLVYPVPGRELPTYLRWRAQATGNRYFGVLFLFDLDPVGKGCRYGSATFGVRFDDERVTAAQVHPDGGALGLVHGENGPFPASNTAVRMVDSLGARPDRLARLSTRIGQPHARVFGVHTADFGWAFEDPTGDVPVRASYGLHGLIEVPPDVVDLSGSLSVQVQIVRTMWRVRSRRHASVGEAVPFRVVLPPGASGGEDTASPMRSSDPGGVGAAVRLCMAADVVGYSRHVLQTAENTQRRLLEVLRAARRSAELNEATIDLQPQGDGQFAVLPPGIDELTAIPRLVRGLRDSLREVNLDLADTARLRLRVALHRGLVKPAANGWVGTSAVAVHRLLDSPQARAAIRDPAVEFIVVVPDFLFRDVISQCFDHPGPDDFQDVTVEIPAKGFVERAWIHVCSRPSAPV
jgi:hypothetical protein